MGEYILSHDIGTSGNKASLFSTSGTIKESCTVAYSTYYPGINCVEQNPEDWWNAICKSTKLLLEKSGISASEVAAISFSGQMMGCLIVDKNGKVLRPMITWADTRAWKQEENMISSVSMERGYLITGHRLSASYSAAKLLWIKQNEPHLYKQTSYMLNAKDYIVYKLTGSFMTDYSDGSSTNLMDINRKEWSEELISAFGINANILPDLYPSATIAGKIQKSPAGLIGLLEGTPVVLGGGDGACACAGAGIVNPGRSYNVLGTSSWVASASSKPYYDKSMRTFNWVHLDKELYTPCGTMQAAGASYAWFKNQLCQQEIVKAMMNHQSPYALINELAEKAGPGANGVLFLPYLMGERSPRWDKKVRGAFLGLDISNTRGDMARAVLESVGFNLRMVISSMEELVDDSIIVIGGGGCSSLWLQILADIWQKKILVPNYLEEATSIGAAVCGGVALGIYENYEVIKSINTIREIIHPNEHNKKSYDELYQLFDLAYHDLKYLNNKLYDLKSSSIVI